MDAQVYKPRDRSRVGCTDSNDLLEDFLPPISTLVSTK